MTLPARTLLAHSLALILTLPASTLSTTLSPARPHTGARANFQEQSTPEKIERLRDEIRRREEIESNTALPSELRNNNHEELNARRGQLREQLEKQLAAAREYRQVVGGDLTDDESQAILDKVGEIEREIGSLTRATEDETGRTRPTTRNETPPAARRPDTNEIALPRANRTDEIALDIRDRGGDGASSSDSGAVMDRDAAPTAVAPLDEASVPPPAIRPLSVTEGRRDSDAADNVDAKAAQTPMPTPTPYFGTAGETAKNLNTAFDAFVERVNVRKRELANKANRGTLPQPEEARNTLLDPAKDLPDLMKLLVVERQRAQYIEEAEAGKQQFEQQVGSVPQNSGTTSLVVKGDTPDVVGFAFENGAFNQTADNSTLTLRGNAVGLAKAFARQNFITGYDVNEFDGSSSNRILRELRKVSFALTYNVNRDQEFSLFTDARQQLVSYSLRYDIANNRDPRDDQYYDLMARYIIGNVAGNAAMHFTPQSKLFTRLRDTLVDFRNNRAAFRWRDPRLQIWYAETLEALNAVPTAAAAAVLTGEIAKVLRDRISRFPFSDLREETAEALDDFLTEATRFTVPEEARERRVLNEIAKGTIFTFDYTRRRGVNAPDTSNLRFIYERGFGGGDDDKVLGFRKAQASDQT